MRKCQVLTMVKETDPDPAKWVPSHKLIGVKPDDLLDFRETMKIRVFEMDYSVPCCGYGFYERRQKLKKEYVHLSNKDIGKMKRENKNLKLSEERIVPLFVFMGDTTVSIFNRYENELFQFPLIIVECSYINSELHREAALEGKHIIWDDLQPFFCFDKDKYFGRFSDNDDFNDLFSKVKSSYTQKTREIIKFCYDFKSAYTYLAFEPALQLEKEYPIQLRFILWPFRAEESFGGNLQERNKFN
ncbi:unnamed protein product [Rotaria sordida]|uniref:Uncharacterized protein n=1 Tax=Rotaria sordida TaxID=392033 RepID=A0A814SRH0_9BILA|nr:unnamed protein product [Rotaria sordida]CAF1150828.1 unnamed protein product [Rotaria sordida]